MNRPFEKANQSVEIIFFYSMTCMQFETYPSYTSIQVTLTRVPEYINFWDGKPLLQREYGVQVHKKKQWLRPKSDYGSRIKSTKNKDSLGSIMEEGSTTFSSDKNKKDSSNVNTRVSCL